MIGIITNEGVSDSGNPIYYLYQSFYKLDFNYLPISLTNMDDIKAKIKLCDGIIMQGGDDFLDIHKDIIKYLYDLLGCIGDGRCYRSGNAIRGTSNVFAYCGRIQCIIRTKRIIYQQR